MECKVSLHNPRTSRSDRKHNLMANAHVTRYGGARITRYSPEGEIDTEVLFPKSLNITSAAFGGPNKDILYVTSGSLNESGDDTDAAKVERYPYSGSVFSVQISGIRGIEKFPFDDVL
jgi:sugar lactone lactonase YvrE